MKADPTAQSDTGRRRRIRNNALRLALFAVAVYIAFIVAFVHQHS